MKIKINATDKLIELDGVPVRVWEGLTEGGIPCLVFVHRIAVRDDHDSTEFDRVLKEQFPPGLLVPLGSVLRRGEAMPEVAEKVILDRQAHERLTALVARVREMRRHQRRWFDKKQQEDLRFARDLERRVDELISTIDRCDRGEKPGQPTLF